MKNSKIDIYSHDLDAAATFAEKAFDRLGNDEIPPVPQNYEVWYVYYANVNPKLRKDINDLLVDQDKLSEQDLADLYEKHLNMGHDREQFERAGDQIMNALKDVAGLVQNIQTQTDDYAGTLQGMNEKLIVPQSPETLRTVVQAISDETFKVIEYNRSLEKRLTKSTEMLDYLKTDMERIRREAITDGLTGLANRKAFDSQIARLGREKDKNQTFSLIMIDIDHFKPFNDTYGHQVGDQVLRLVALTLIDEIKGQDMAARYGGEEFAILLPNTEITAARHVAENLRKAISRKEIINRMTGENLGQITISLGVAQHDPVENVESLIRKADRALYASKHAGRNTLTLADQKD